MRWPFSRRRLISISFSPPSPRGLQRVGLAAHDDRRPRRRPAVNDRAGALRGAVGFAPPPAQDAREREVDALQRPQHARLQRRRRVRSASISSSALS